MNYPLFRINLDKITNNARAIVNLCGKYGIEVSGVVKSACGSPEIAHAMLAGGLRQLGDSRIANFERLRANGINAEFIMLRIPMLSQCAKIVSLCEFSLNSEMPVITALGREALKIKRLHKIILMIDVGDLREGVLPEDAPCIAEQISELPGLYLAGIGTNLTCYGGVKPTEENLTLLTDCAVKIEKRLGRKLDIISGGNSSSLSLVMNGKMPQRINHLRIGEAILLGQETLACTPLPGTVQDAFIFDAEIIEAGRKPSAPIGEVVRDAFGRCPDFENRGIRRRAILGAGRQDIVPEGLKPLIPNVKILGASSDHLLVDIDDSSHPINTGDIMSFGVEYSALLSAMTSLYVNKEFHTTDINLNEQSRVQIIYVPSSVGANMPGSELAPEILVANGLLPRIADLDLNIEDPITLLDKRYSFNENSSLEEKLTLVNSINRKIANQVKNTIKSEKIPLLIGGDHTVTVGATAGFIESRTTDQEVGLIMFGAFANFNTISSSKSGNLHGLTLAACINSESELNLVKNRVLHQENVVLIGVRDLEKAERQHLQNSQINIFTMEKIDYLGMRETMNQVLAGLRHCNGGVHVSFAMDVLSPEQAPGVSLPVEGGLNLREVHLALEMLYSSKLVASVDFVEFNPERDNNNITAQRALSLICTILGKKII